MLMTYYIFQAREVISTNPLQLGNDPQTTARTAIRVTIYDINDQAPTFNPINYQVTIPEDIPNKTPLPNLALSVNDLDVVSFRRFWCKWEGILLIKVLKSNHLHVYKIYSKKCTFSPKTIELKFELISQLVPIDCYFLHKSDLLVYLVCFDMYASI